MVRTLFRLALTLLVPGAAMEFKAPRDNERLDPIGAKDALPETLRRALTAGEDFEPVPEPGPSDWLANHPEPGQTFEQFVRCNPLKPDRKRSKLYLQWMWAGLSLRGPALN